MAQLHPKNRKYTYRATFMTCFLFCLLSIYLIACGQPKKEAKTEEQTPKPTISQQVNMASQEASAINPVQTPLTDTVAEDPEARKKLLEFVQNNNIDVSELEGLPIYSEIKKVIDRDGSVAPRLLKLLKDPSWKTTTIEKITFFYSTEDEEILSLANEANAQIKKIQNYLKLDNNLIENLEITCFVFNKDLWDKFSSLPSFHFKNTSQLYLRTTPWCTFSNFSHELTHIILNHAWKNHNIPLWLSEGLSCSMEEWLCLIRHGGEVFRQPKNWIDEIQGIPLKELLSTGYIMKNPMLFYSESLYFIQFLTKIIGEENIPIFIKYYLEKADPSIKDFEDAYSKVTGTPQNIADIDKSFFSFIQQVEPNIPKNVPTIKLDFDSTVFDAGEIKRDKPARFSFVGTNNTGEILHLQVIQMNCGTTTLDDVSNKRLLPNEKIIISGSITIGTDPCTKPYEVWVLVETPKEASKVVLSIKATVRD